MATITHCCEHCQQESNAFISQSIGSEGARWNLSFRCPTCGRAFEANCGYDTPKDIRDIFLATGGVWSLEVAPTDAQRMQAIKVLRDVLHLSLVDVARLKNAIPGRVLDGTRAEMQFLQLRLAEAGIPSSVVGTANAQHAVDTHFATNFRFRLYRDIPERKT